MKDDRQDHGGPGGTAAKDTRQQRLKSALRENLKRRKSQARERGDFMPASPASDEVTGPGGNEGPAK
jgi:hypothetical protein